ncbi:MAG: hypothetical protein ACTTIC_07425 [Helicobacteraceae bacterium]
MLTKFKLNNNIGNTLDKLIKNKVLLSSSVAFCMMKNFDKQASFDENAKHVWGNLKEDYPDYFSDDAAALENLKLLAGIENIENHHAG